MVSRIDEKEIRIKLAIGGLFHDIGKFILRALSKEEIKKHYSQVKKDKDYREEFKYTHAYTTFLFINKYINKYLDDEIISSSAYHHNPDKAPNKLVAKIYQQADFSSSAERSEKERQEETNLLRSIFQSIHLPKNKQNKVLSISQTKEYYYKLLPLNLTKDVLFPLTQEKLKSYEKVEEYEKKGYTNLWKGFREEFEQSVEKYIKEKNLYKFLLNSYYLIYKYLWCIPASIYDPERKEKHYPDISLFDHLRITSAFSTSLYTYYNIDKIEKNQEKDAELVFIKGDISGIQKFLYGITNVEGVAKRLRGRSSFLTLLPELVAKNLVDTFGYPFVNILYCSGGHFEIVLGYEKNIEEELGDFSNRLDEILFKEFNGQLGLVFSHHRIKLDEIKASDAYIQINKELYSQLDEKKKRKYLNLLNKNPLNKLMNMLNEKENIKETHKICHSCEIVVIEEKEEVCKWCKKFKEVGSIIPRANYLIFIDKKIQEEKFRNLAGFYVDGIGGVYFTKKIDDIKKILSEGKEILKINNTDFIGKCDGFKFLAQIVPINTQNGEETIMTFEELAQQAEGDEKLVFAKGDVDNLGLIFMKGLEKEYSISRIATLSRTFELFFSGYLNSLFNEETEFKNKIYVLYAGGDDFFIIGPWDVTLDALNKIRDDFKEYTCNNPDIDLSCGVFVNKESYPIRFAGEKAGEEEGKAKDIKPAIIALSESLKWDEYNTALKKAKEMADFLKNKKISRSLLYKIYLLINEFKEAKNKNEISVHPKFYPYFYYFLYRNIRNENEREEIGKFFLDVEKDYQIRKDVLFKIKYAIMKTRE